jgi:hypothetical protein
LASSIRTDFAKRQAEYKEKSNAQIAAASLPKTAELATGAEAKAPGDSNVEGEGKEGSKDHNSDHSTGKPDNFIFFPRT